jgi:hypothetical protein
MREEGRPRSAAPTIDSSDSESSLHRSEMFTECDISKEILAPEKRNVWLLFPSSGAKEY